MTDRLADVEGIGAAYAATLAAQGLATTDDLLARGARPAGRAALAEVAGIAPALILEWVNHVDLFRIKGVAGQFADLLEEAGVDTVVELARRNPDNLVTALAEANAAKNLANRNPSATEVADWVAQAQALPRAVFYDDSDGAAAAPSTPAPAPTPAAAPVAAAAPVPAANPAPASGPRPAAMPAAPVPAAAVDDRSWLTKLIDRIRGTLMDDLLKGLGGGQGGQGGGVGDLLGSLLGGRDIGSMLGAGAGAGLGNAMGGGVGSMVGGGLGALLPTVLPAVLGMLGGQGSAGQGAAGPSGMHQLTDAMHANGLGDIARSWIGGGPNLPISAAQVAQVLSPAQMAELSAKTGLPAEQVSAAVAGILPDVVNHLTPNGNLPDHDQVRNVTSQLQEAFAGFFGPKP